MKTCIKIAILLLLPLSLTAQTKQKSSLFDLPHNLRKFNFGVKGSILVNGLSSRLPDYFNDRYVGFKGGFIGRVNFRKFYIQPELVYAYTGGRLEFQDNASYDIRMHALEVPVLFGYRFINAGIFNLRVNAGPVVSWNFARSAKFSDPNYPSNNTFSGNDLRPYTVGLTVGLGVDFWKFNLDGRYQWGFTDLLNSRRLVQDPGAGFRNGIWEIGLTYKIF